MRSLTPDFFYFTLAKEESGKKYLKLIEEARKSGVLPEGESLEVHHIHPLGLGGPDIPSNKICLTVFQHCLAHLYLAECFCYPETYFVLNKMSGRKIGGLPELEKISLEEVHRWSKNRSILKNRIKGLNCVIHNPETGIIRRIPKEELSEWVSEGFILGVPEKKKIANKLQNKGRITIGNEELQQNKMVPKKDLQEYLRKGWHLGRISSTKNSLKGRIPIYKDSEEKHVRPDSLQEYLESGWQLGTGPKQRINHGKTMKGRIRVYKGDKENLIYPEDLSEYLNQGYLQGRMESYKNRTRGHKIINKDGVMRRVGKEEASRLVREEGWQFGVGTKLQ